MRIIALLSKGDFNTELLISDTLYNTWIDHPPIIYETETVSLNRSLFDPELLGKYSFIQTDIDACGDVSLQTKLDKRLKSISRFIKLLIFDLNTDFFFVSKPVF